MTNLNKVILNNFPDSCIHTHIHTHTHIYKSGKLYIYTQCVYTHTHTHTHRHTYTHTHTHTHTQTSHLHSQLYIICANLLQKMSPKLNPPTNGIKVPVFLHSEC